MASRRRLIETLCDVTYLRSMAYSQQNSQKLRQLAKSCSSACLSVCTTPDPIKEFL
jgi:hypothetical protein